jgi:triosephosphate isomerase
LNAYLARAGVASRRKADELLALPDVDGALVGGASLELDSFISICRSGATS